MDAETRHALSRINRRLDLLEARERRKQIEERATAKTVEAIEPLVDIVPSDLGDTLTAFGVRISALET